MVTYTAHERDSDVQDIALRAEGIVFVKDGFAWLALLFPIIWLIYHRMWIVLAGFVASVVLLEAGVLLLGLPDEIAVMITIALSIVVALQANDLRLWSLARKGYQLADLMSGRDRGECEEKFFTQWLAASGDAFPKKVQRAKPAPSGPGKSSSEGDDIIGLFPEPGN